MTSMNRPLRVWCFKHDIMVAAFDIATAMQAFEEHIEEMSPDPADLPRELDLRRGTPWQDPLAHMIDERLKTAPPPFLMEGRPGLTEHATFF